MYVEALELCTHALAAAYHGGELPACDHILPEGAYQGLRKDLSHRGMVRLPPGRQRLSTDWYDPITKEWTRDPTNLVYGCAGRYLKHFLVPNTVLHRELSRLGDEKIGDVVEALLGLAWLARINDPWNYEGSMQARLRRPRRTSCLCAAAITFRTRGCTRSSPTSWSTTATSAETTRPTRCSSRAMP